VSEPFQVSVQQSLFEEQEPSFDPSFSGMERIQLDQDSWIDYLPHWVRAPERLFQEVLSTRQWAQRKRWMYERKVLEPRLTSMWSIDSGSPLQPSILEEMRLSLSQKYDVRFDSAGFNLYRNGQDAVAWHGDRIIKEIPEPIVVLVSLGERRRLLMRPKGGGRSRPFPLGDGDLFVTGGKTQRTWEHTVPRVARAGPRISIAFRHGLDPRAYGRSGP
jgi:alkylated DNA repair dioxygenase AlkB